MVVIKSICSFILVAMLSTSIQGADTFKIQPDWVLNSMKVAQTQAMGMLPEVLKSGKLPRSQEKGLRETSDWTSGFYPGELWLLYKYTGDEFWKENARKVTTFLEKEQYNKNDHDIGFRIYCSYGNGWLLTKSEEYKKVIVQAAQSLVSRYNEKTHTIMSWGKRPERDWKYPVIIDNMMNLELLAEASKLTGNELFKKIAIEHADRTMKDHYRKDYSCPHVVDYDPETGAFRKMDWNNGYSDPKVAVWSRGQGWGLYGFTMMYRETKDLRYLQHAEKVAEFILKNPNMPEDMVPYWDFSSPKVPTMRDASAAAIIASALMELSTYSTNGKRYFEAGEKMLKSLSSGKYQAASGTNAHYLLKHATGNFIQKGELDGTLIYADYYFVEGLIRYLQLINNEPLFPLCP